MGFPRASMDSDDNEAPTATVAAAILLDERLDPIMAELRGAIDARETAIARSRAVDLAAAAEELQRALSGDPVDRGR